MINGKKSDAQLGREVNDILAARQKREAREQASKFSKNRAIESAVLGRLEQSRIASQAEYERRELAEANQKIREVESAPLADRKEAAAEFFEAMRDQPEMIAERLGWLLEGQYGYGAMRKAKQVLKSPRMNRSAALSQMIAVFEWNTPGPLAVAAWKRLTKGQQATLEKVVQSAIRGAERKEREE